MNIDRKLLQNVINKVRDYGPERLVIYPNGAMVSYSDATQRDVDIIFFRTDGITVGTRKEFEAVTYEKYRRYWIGFMRTGPMPWHYQPMDKYENDPQRPGSTHNMFGH